MVTVLERTEGRRKAHARFSTPSLRWLSKADLPQLNITTLSVRPELQKATPREAVVAKGAAPTVDGAAGQVAIHAESHQLGVTRYRLMSSEDHLIQTLLMRGGASCPDSLRAHQSDRYSASERRACDVLPDSHR